MGLSVEIIPFYCFKSAFLWEFCWFFRDDYIQKLLTIPEFDRPELRDAIHALRKEMKRVIGLKRREFLKKFEEFAKSAP